jgi:hypothetical protein
VEHLPDAPNRSQARPTGNTQSSTQSRSATATQLKRQPFVALRIFPQQNSSSISRPHVVVPSPAHEQQQHGHSDVTEATPWAAAPPAADRGREKDSFRGSGRKSEQGPSEEGHRQSREETWRGHNPTREEQGGEGGVLGGMVRGCQREAYEELAEQEVTHLQQEGRGRNFKTGTTKASPGPCRHKRPVTLRVHQESSKGSYRHTACQGRSCLQGSSPGESRGQLPE